MSDQDATDITINYVIGDFQTSEHAVPRESMQWSLDHWEEIVPRFLEVLSRVADGTDRSAEAEIALFFIIRLLAEKAETRAFRHLCALLLERNALPSLAGDAITATLSQILIGTFDGNADLLRSVVERADVNEFVRHAAITAIAYLTRSGRIPEADTRDWLQRLATDMQPRAACFIWIGWVECVADLGLAELAPDAQRLFELGYIDDKLMKFSDFTRELQRTLDDPDPMAPFAPRKLGPYTGAIAELETWYNSAEPDAAGDWDDDEQGGSRSPAWSSGGGDHNPWRHVGRNDPCPCGSGRKFKKCCLGKAGAEPPVLTVMPRGRTGSRRGRFGAAASQ